LATSRFFAVPSRVVAVIIPTPLISFELPSIVMDPPPTVRIPVILASPFTTRAVNPAPGVPIVAPAETNACVKCPSLHSVAAAPTLKV